MGYSNEEVPANGSFLASKGGTFKYIGNKGSDKNQIATFDPKTSSLNSTNLEDLIDQFSNNYCVSQVSEDPPEERPEGESLEIGDLWSNPEVKDISVWDGDEWIRVGIGSSTVDAPLDGNFYVRQSGQWVDLQSALNQL